MHQVGHKILGKKVFVIPWWHQMARNVLEILILRGEKSGIAFLCRRSLARMCLVFCVQSHLQTHKEEKNFALCGTFFERHKSSFLCLVCDVHLRVSVPKVKNNSCRSKWHERRLWQVPTNGDDSNWNTSYRYIRCSRTRSKLDFFQLVLVSLFIND